MKAIKALVLFMGILIVAGLGVLGYGLSQQSDDKAAATTVTASPGIVSGSGAGSFGAISVTLPTGSRVEQVLVAGERVVVRVTGGADGERLVVLDPRSGAIAGSFVLAVEPPQAPAR